MNQHVRDNLNALTRAGSATGLSPTTSSADITSSTSELSLRTAGAAGNTTGWLIPAGLIGTDRIVKLVAHGDMLYNQAGSPTLRFRVYLRDGSGTNTLLFDDTATGSAGTSASRQPWHMEINVAALGSASSQIMWGQFHWVKDTAPTSGIGGINNIDSAPATSAPSIFADDSASAVDMSAARYLDVTGTWSTSSASLSWRLKYATLVAL